MDQLMFEPEDGLTPPPISRGDSFNVLSSPYWIGVFILVALPFFVVFFYVTTFFEIPLLTAEQLYALLAIFSGMFSDIFLRRWLYVALAIVRNPRVPFLLIWVLVCLAILLFQPFKNFEVWFSN